MALRQTALGVSIGLLAVFLAGCLPTSSTTEDKDATVPPKSDLAVEVRPGTGAYAIRGNYSVIFRFHNNSSEPISILKPLDGSCERQMPDYRVRVWDGNGQIVEPGGGCRSASNGLWAGTKWPQDYLVEIKPGSTFDEEYPVPVAKDGKYTIAFEYVYEPNNELHPPSPSAWRGSVKAPKVVLNFKLE